MSVYKSSISAQDLNSWNLLSLCTTKGESEKSPKSTALWYLIKKPQNSSASSDSAAAYDIICTDKSIFLSKGLLGLNTLNTFGSFLKYSIISLIDRITNFVFDFMLIIDINIARKLSATLAVVPTGTVDYFSAILSSYSNWTSLWVPFSRACAN